jgi:hypothetical protein
MQIRTLIRFTLYFFSFALLTSAAMLSLSHFGYSIVMKENNIIEWLEAVWLLLSSLFLILAACRSVEYKEFFSVLWLLPLIAAARELDGEFDRFFHGAWIIPAMFITALVFYRTFNSFYIFKKETLNFIHTQQAVFLFIGFFVVVIFAQICGQQSVMRAVLQEHYQRCIGRFMEEIMEFLGYILIVIGSIECFINEK